LLRFRQAHPALRRGDLTQLLVNQEQYAYLRSSPEERVLIVLNRAGSAKPMAIDVDDLVMPDDTRLRPFSGDSPDVVVSGGKATIEQPKEIQIYWAGR
jgi:hypothetical protein